MNILVVTEHVSEFDGEVKEWRNIYRNCVSISEVKNVLIIVTKNGEAVTYDIMNIKQFVIY